MLATPRGASQHDFRFGRTAVTAEAPTALPAPPCECRRSAAERRHVLNNVSNRRNYFRCVPLALPVLSRRHAASATAPTNSSNTVPGSGTDAGPPDTGAPAGRDVCTAAGLEACSAALLSMLLVAGMAAKEIDSLVNGDAATISPAPVMLPNTTRPLRPTTSTPEVGNAWALFTFNVPLLTVVPPL